MRSSSHTRNHLHDHRLAKADKIKPDDKKRTKSEIEIANDAAPQPLSNWFPASVYTII